MIVVVVTIGAGVTTVERKDAQCDARMLEAPKAWEPVTAAAQASPQVPRSKSGFAKALPARASATMDLENIICIY